MTRSASSAQMARRAVRPRACLSLVPPPGYWGMLPLLLWFVDAVHLLTVFIG